MRGVLNRKNILTALAVVVIVGIAWGGYYNYQHRVIETVIIDWLPPPNTELFDLDGVVMSDDRTQIALKYRDKLTNKVSVTYHNGESKLYQDIAGLRFSSDGSRIAYSAIDDGGIRLVIDGEESQRFDDLEWPVFSPNGRYLACFAKLGDTWRLLIDGEERDSFHDAVPYVAYSPDSRRLAYFINENKKRYVVIDNRREGPYDIPKTEAPFWFSPSSQRYAYPVQIDGEIHVIIDGTPQGPYDSIGYPLLFSPDSRHLAFPIRGRNQSYWVIDGQQQGPYTHLVKNSVVYSPNSQRIAYAVVSGKKQLVIIDGKRDPLVDAVKLGSLCFSADSRHYAYLAKIGDAYALVVDGQQHDALYQDVSGLQFYRGNHTVFVTKSVGYSYVVRDNQLGAPYKQIIGAVQCNPRTQRLAWVAELADGSKAVIVNDRVRTKYNFILTDTLRTTPTGERLTFLGIKDDKIYRVSVPFD